MDMASGRVVGQYRIDQPIGAGGLAKVYRATHTQLGSVHAIKFLGFANAELRERLMLEGRIQAQLRHPNIVAVTDVVEDSGQLGLVMEFVEGPTLSRWLADRGARPVDEALALFEQLLAALGAAHSVGVLHRDLKPDNVLLTLSSGGAVAKVADFGIAKVMEAKGQNRTLIGRPMGTPGYMAPEQVEGRDPPDARTDIFAMGVILYELLSGRPAIRGDSMGQTLKLTLLEDPPPIAEVVEGVPVHVAAAVHKALSKDRADRHESCAAFFSALFPDREVRPSLSGFTNVRLSAPTIAPVGGTFVPEDLEGFERAAGGTAGGGLHTGVLGAPPPTAPPGAMHTGGPTAGPPQGTATPTSYFPMDEPAPTIAPATTHTQPPPSSGGGAWKAIAVFLAVAAGGLGVYVFMSMQKGDPAPAVVAAAPAPALAQAQPAVATDPERAPEEPALEPTADPVQAAQAEAATVPSPRAEGAQPAQTQATAPGPAEAAPEEASTGIVAEPEAAPTEDAVADAAAETKVEPTPAAEPPAEPEPAPEAAPTLPDLSGSWKGSSRLGHVVLSLKGGSTGSVSGTVRINLGATPRTVSVSGTLSGDPAVLNLSGKGLELRASVQGNQLMGSKFMLGNKDSGSWSAKR